MVPRRAHRCESISSVGTDVDLLRAQVRARGDDCTGVCCLGAQGLRRGAHGRASRRRKIALDWSAEGGPRDPLLPWYVLILLPISRCVDRERDGPGICYMLRRRVCSSGQGRDLRDAWVPPERVQGCRRDRPSQLLCVRFPSMTLATSRSWF